MRRWPWLLFTGSLILRLGSIAAATFWYDENLTALFSQLPLPNLLTAMTGDVHPPLFYLIEWVVSHTLGANEFTLRLPSALFGAGGVVLLYHLVTRMAGQRPGQWAGVLMALMPGQIYYSQEARMYSMLTFFVLFAASAIHQRNWLRAGLTLPLILTSQNLGAVYVVILGLWALWSSRGKALKHLLFSGALYIPQALIALKQFQNVGSGFWLPPSGNFGGALYWIFFTTFFLRMPEWLQLHSIFLALTLTIITIYLLRHQIKALAPLFVVAFVPPFALYAISLIWHPVLLDRALLPSGAALVGLWGIAGANLPKWSKLPLAALVSPVMIALIITYYQDPTQQRATRDPMAELISAQWQDGDVIYHTHLTSYISFEWYLPDKPSYILPETGDLAQSLSNQTKEAMGITRMEYLPQALRHMGYRRMWLVSGWTVVSSQLELDSQDLFVRSYPILNRWKIIDNKLERIELFLMDLSGSKVAGG